MSFAQSRNAHISNSFSGEQRLTGQIDGNPGIVKIYSVSRQLQGITNFNILHHAAIIFKTTEGKFGICEWTNESKVLYYYIKIENIDAKNEIDDGQYKWCIEKVDYKRNIQDFNELQRRAKYFSEGKYKEYNLGNNNCQDFVARVLGDAQLTLIEKTIVTGTALAVNIIGEIALGTLAAGPVGFCFVVASQTIIVTGIGMQVGHQFYKLVSK